MKLIGLTALCLLPTASAAAQDPRPLPPPPAFVAMDSGSLMRLAERPDVQNELRLDLKQKHALAALTGHTGGASRITVRASAEPGRNPEDDIRRQIEEHFSSMDSKLAEILKPEQMARLKELDLQFRGPIALGDPKVAERAELRKEIRPQIAKIAADYNARRSQIIFEHSQVHDSSEGEGRLMRMVKGPDLSNPLSPVRKQLDPLRKETESQILALLNEEETARWQRMQGARFTFRMDLPAARRGRP